MDESMPKLYETHKFLTNSSDRVNGFLGELMNSRIVEFTQIHDHQKTANESNSTKSSYNNSKIPKIKSSKNENLSIRINELKANILRKQCLYDNAKSKTQIIKKLQQYTEFRQNNINAKQEIHDAYAYDLEQYVVSLRELKSELEVTNKLDLSNNSEDQVAKYKNIVNFCKFYILIQIEELDKSGISLNQTLKTHIEEVNSHEVSLSSKIDKINKLIDDRAHVKEQ